MALKAPSNVTVARQQQQIAGYGWSAARSSFLPQLEYNNSFTYNSAPLASASAGVFGRS